MVVKNGGGGRCVTSLAPNACIQQSYGQILTAGQTRIYHVRVTDLDPHRVYHFFSSVLISVLAGDGTHVLLVWR